MIRPSLRRGRGPALRSSRDDDTGLDYYDKPADGRGRPAPSLPARGDASGGPSANGQHNAL
jgi:hypothetical protein